MVLRRTTLILLIALGVVIAGGVAVYLIFPEQVREAFQGPTTTQNANTNSSSTNSSATPTNLSTTQDLTGDTPMTASVKISNVDVKLSSLDRIPSFDQTDAPENQQYVVVYIDGVEPGATAAVFEAFSQAQLVNGNERYSPAKLKVATTIVKNDRGYVAFLAPDGAQDLVLEVGSGPEAQRVELP